MNKILIIVTLLFIAYNGYTQHCRYDGSAFIMLDVKSEKPVSIKNIYLLDYSGAIHMHNTYYGDSVVTDSSIFWKNPVKQPTNDDVDKREYFRFAKDYHVVHFGHGDGPFKVMVEFVSGKKVQTKVFEVPREHVHVLCTTNSALWKGEKDPLTITIK